MKRSRSSGAISSFGPSKHSIDPDDDKILNGEEPSSSDGEDESEGEDEFEDDEITEVRHSDQDGKVASRKEYPHIQDEDFGRPKGSSERVKPNGRAHDRIGGPLPPGLEDDGTTDSQVQTVADANGNERFLYPEVDPTYDSDDSDAQQPTNTIGNIPLSFYDSYPHIGYTIDGQRITRPAKGEALDTLLNTIEIPQGWTGLTDPSTGLPLELSGEQLDLLRQVARDEIPDEDYDMYTPMVEYFSSQTEVMPLSAAPEPKRRFVPSRHEAKRVMKIVKAIKEGRIKPYRPDFESLEDDTLRYYDIWSSEGTRNQKISNIPAPRLAPPMHDESYNPPLEYLPTDPEKEVWLQTEAEDRDKEYLPHSYGVLRRVPGYERFVKERFERCLDLYLAPRIRRARVRADAESLLPKLPSPEELRPYPSYCATIFEGHKGRVRCLSMDATGQWLATGGDDGTIRIWELPTGRQIWSAVISHEHAMTCVEWRPDQGTTILVGTADNQMFFMVPPVGSSSVEEKSHAILNAGFGYAASSNTKSTVRNKPATASWIRPANSNKSESVAIQVMLKSPPKSVSWHRAGTYLVTTAPTLSYHSVAVHNLSKHSTQLPFKHFKGLPQAAHFHPTKPHLFVATQQSIRVYDLQLQTLIQTLKPGARHLSSLSLHPGGNNLIAGSYDRRLLWHDLELSPKLPYKTLRYHSRAIRDVAIHQGGLPLFASCSDDGTLQIYHGRVVDDGMENVNIVPVKILRGHQVEGSLGVLGVEWHPKEAWCVSCGADGVARLWM